MNNEIKPREADIEPAYGDTVSASHPELGQLLRDDTGAMAPLGYAPAGETERGLARIWEELLGVHLPNGEADFFAHGGDSLLAIQLVDRVHKTFSTVLSLPDLLHHSSVTQLAALIESRIRENRPVDPRAAEIYWHRRLQTLPPPPELPLVLQSSTIIKPTYNRRIDQLSGGDWEGIKQSAALRRTTPAMVLCTAFAETLSGWSRSQRFTIHLMTWAPSAAHSDGPSRDFPSVLPLEAEIDDGPFEARLTALQAQLWQDLQHRQSGFPEHPRQANESTRTAAPRPVLFSSALGISSLGGNEAMQAFPASPRNGSDQAGQFCIGLMVDEDAKELRLQWDMVEGMLPPGVPEAMFEAYGRLLRDLARNPGAWTRSPRAQIKASTLAERAPANDFDPAQRWQNLHQPWLASASQRADHPAVISAGASLSHGELDAASARLAAALAARGTRKGDRVAVLMEKGPEQIVALMAILRAGGIYVPIEASQPDLRIAELCRHCLPQLILTQSRISAAVKVPEELASLCVDQPQNWGVCEHARFDLPMDASDPAYIIYTSGSTGQPKGVAIEHGSAANTIADINQRFEIGPSDRILGLSALGFDLSVYDVFGLLGAGGAVVLPAPAALRDPSAWYALLQRETVTIWNTVPALFEMLVAYFEERQCRPSHTLRLVLLSGDWIPISLIRRARALFPDTQLVSLGGATEASIWSVIHPIERLELNWPSVPYGRPLRGQTLQILDTRLQPRPDWVAGELFIGGRGLARGYWRDEAQTQECFITHPETGERLYRTGDLARFRPGGIIEFLGRLDNQIKLRGHRIEPGEIEVQLTAHPKVSRALVMSSTDSKHLLAYVAGPEASDVSEAEMKAFLALRLPGYMVPMRVFSLAALPLTPNGKVNLAALGALHGEDAQPGTSTQASELRLTALWEDELGISGISPHDNFFALGGNSLSALRLTERIRDLLQFDLPLSILFEKPTVHAFARAIGELGEQAGAAAALPQVQPDPDRLYEAFPLTSVQQAYWLGRLSSLELGNVGTAAYMEFDRKDREINLGRLGAAIDRLVERHPMLRVVLRPDGTQRVKERLPGCSIPLNDFTSLDQKGLEQSLEAVRSRLRDTPMDLYAGPLFRLEASRLPDRFRLHVAVEMIIADAFSLRLLVQELASIYRDLQTFLPPLAFSYRDYVLALQDLQKSPAYERARQYWLDRVPHLPLAPELPLAQKPTEIVRPIFQRHSFVLTHADWVQIKAQAAELQVTPTVVLCTSFAEVLARWSTPHFTINLTTYHRVPVHPEINKIVGDFTSISLLEIRSGSAPFRERAQATQHQLWRDLEHRQFDGIAVMRAMRKHRGEAPGATMPVVFTSTLGHVLSEDDEQAIAEFGSPVENTGQTPQVWLDCQLVETEHGVGVQWDSVEGLFPQGLIGAMFDAFCKQLNRLAQVPQSWEAQPAGFEWSVSAALANGQVERRIARLLQDHPAIAQCTPDPSAQALMPHVRVLPAVIVEAMRADPRQHSDSALPNEGDPPDGVIAKAHERARFQLSEHGLRPVQGVRLNLPGRSEEALATGHARRHSARTFRSGIVGLTQFAGWLEALRRVILPGRPLPKYRYPSAGALHPVQAYLWIRPGTVEGIDPGAYYYDPRAHALASLSLANFPADGFGSHNRQPAQEAAFALILVADMAAVRPMYGPLARDFCLLEAGAMLQLLMMEAPMMDLGVCPVGQVEASQADRAFLLGEDHEVLLGMLGGLSSQEWSQAVRPDATFTDQGHTAPDAAALRNWLQELSCDPVPCFEVTVGDAFEARHEHISGSFLAAAAMRSSSPSARRRQDSTFEDEFERTVTLIARLWARTLDLAQFGGEEDCFSRGATSLDAVRVHAELERQMSRPIPLVALFEHTTPVALARLLIHQQGGGDQGPQRSPRRRRRNPR